MTKRSIGRFLILLLCAAAALGLLAAAAQADGEITTWADLQAAFNAGGTVTLMQNVTAGENDGPLTIPEGKTVILDLKGFGIDRGLYEAVEDGYVLHNAGTLTVRDTSRVQTGTISGGYNSEFEQNGGVPYGYNRGGGIYNTGTLTLESGSITGNRAKDDGGVLNSYDATFIMTGGDISDNTSYKYGGSGVTNYGTFTMSGGTITGNSAVTWGGGVWNFSDFTMTGGTISGNTAGRNGGGICARTGTAYISGGTITGNSATGTAAAEANGVTGCGGGLYIDVGGIVTLTGGSITGNTAATNGNGVFLNVDSAMSPVLNMSGSPVADVYLAAGKVITVTGAFTEDADISVATVAGTGVFTSGYGANNANDHPSQYFRASDTANSILLGASEAEIGVGTVVHDVSYVERRWNGTAVVSETKIRDAIEVPTSGNMSSGWYILNSNVTKNGRVESITGDVHLILGDGFTLDVKGLYVPQGSTLTIYGQAEGTGKIDSHPSGGAAIGGYSGHNNGNIVIHGGTIVAKGYDHCAGIGTNDGKTGGAITIYGGTITAKGGNDGAAIGGGRNCSGGTINIYGGNITANGSTDSDCCENGAGIGGGDCGAGGTLTIHGGTITTYSRDGAGIGGGDDGAGGTITIYGGDITSTKVNNGQGARIGGGCDAAPGTITIHGGTITTVGGKGAGIGGGKGNESGGSVTIYGGIISASGSYGIGKGEDGADVSITLGHTDATMETISITASSYDGTVTAEQPFKTDTALIYPGAVTDVSPLAGSTLAAWDGRITSWHILQLAVNSAQDGWVITLQQSLTANSSNTAVVVPAGKNITLDLNGFTLDRAMTDAAADGYVIRNNGTLIIIDSGDSEAAGTIRGGWNTGDGGGIYNTGTLNLQGGLIESNKSGGNGGGIYNAGTVNMTGGTIRLNSADTGGGGVHVSESANLVVSGSPTVENNTKGELANNINLAGNAVIQVNGALAEGARLGVFISGAFGVFTDGYGANNTASPDSFFFADTGGWCVFLEEGEGSLSSIWEQFRLSLNQGGSIALTEDITAFPYDSILSIPAGVTVELDLQGHTLDASALNPPAGVEYPCCLSINGNFTLSDTVGGGRFKGGDNGFIDFIATESGSSFTMCGGTIVGSGTLENVVYVYDYASFTMCGGAVTADMNGTVRRFGRVSVDDYATFIMNDGTISGSGGQSDIYADGGCVWLNGGSLTGSDPAYGNVYVLSADQIKNGQLFVSGSPLMSKGVYLDYDHTITVAGPLGEDVIIPVMTEAKPTSAEPVIITNGLAQGGENAVSHFTSASDIWCVVLNDDGEAELRKAPTEWDTLQLLIDGTENGGVLTLEKDYTATNKDRYLNIAGGKALTIDLNGHTIDGSALNDDYVMTISGNLTLRDSTGGGTVLGRNHQDVIKTTSENAVLCIESGTIHGDNCYDVVYVYAGGSFIMTGGTVSGSGSSGHIDVLVECGTFTLTGGSIRADQKGSDTAVLTTKYTNFNLQGSPDIRGSFELGKPVQFTGPISHDLRIKVRRTGDLHNEWNDVFTSGLPGNGTVNNFISYYPKNYAVGLNEAGEAFLGSPVTVAFAPGYETNETMETVSWAKDGWYPLPACGFSGPAGQAFAGWQIGEDTELKNVGDLVSITGDMTLTAVWQDIAFGNPDFVIPGSVSVIEDNAFEGIAATVVEIPGSCTRISDEAFKDCAHLTMIRIPAGCVLGTDVFEGCVLVYVFGTVGSPAEGYCDTHENCVFVPAN